MADNFLERQQRDYEAAKAARQHAAKLKWQKQLRAYRERLAAQKSATPPPDPSPDSTSTPK